MRAFTADKDYTFGRGAQTYLVDVPEVVGQAIYAVLNLFQGEWYIDLTAGIPWTTRIIGKNSKASVDQILQNAIAGVQGVQAIVEYDSEINTATRALTVHCRVQTIYGEIDVEAPIALPTGFGFGAPTFGGYPFGG